MQVINQIPGMRPNNQRHDFFQIASFLCRLLDHVSNLWWKSFLSNALGFIAHFDIAAAFHVAFFSRCSLVSWFLQSLVMGAEKSWMLESPNTKTRCCLPKSTALSALGSTKGVVLDVVESAREPRGLRHRAVLHCPRNFFDCGESLRRHRCIAW